MFESPIQLITDSNTLSEQCVNDLQLDKIYSHILGDNDDNHVREMWLTHYTTNKSFLKETQKLLKNTTKYPLPVSTLDVKEIFDGLKEDISFREKYGFITTKLFEKLNNYEQILQFISVYTLTSPILSLLTPLFLIFIPFFILRIVGKKLNISNYLNELKRCFEMLPIGKLFQMGQSSWDQRGFIVFSIILYIVQMYQNSLTCYKFYNNSQKMVNDIHKIGTYCQLTSESMMSYNNLIKNLPTYSPFYNTLISKIGELNEISKKFSNVSIKTFKDMGLKMHLFYNIYCNEEYNELFKYTFSYHEYVKNVSTFSKYTTLNNCRFSNIKMTFTDAYYALLQEESAVKNSYSVKKNAIMSGPNASGKTTILKSTMINIILSQQIGKGFYKKASIIPQDHFHCYINIPDTCGRDSLFQAEARRCREILNVIEINSDAKHFCIFDELFSGTNPYEAIGSATGYLNHINKYDNVKYMLTTHYLDLCKNFNNSLMVENYTLENYFHLEKGISSVKGGIKILEALDFPSDIIQTAKRYVSLD